jgi:7-carboxy-7-deazaguanine synthase
VSYSIKEIFYSLQGEGANAGRAAVFCRFAGCNLWSGRERDRQSAICQFCDTDFLGTDGAGGGVFQSADEVAAAVDAAWPRSPMTGARRFVVCTGGEPLLQLDPPLIRALQDQLFEVAVETNGTKTAPSGLDWITVSPKAGAKLVVQSGQEIKVVFPQDGAEPERYEHLDFQHFFVQPMDGPHRDKNTEAALRFCLGRPRWRLSLQMHKALRIP